MIKIQIYKENSRFKTNDLKIKKLLISFYEKRNFNDLNISIAFVSKKTMLSLAKKYYKDTRLHNVFSFEDPKEIVVCLETIKSENELYKLLIHSAKHTIGIHHR
jgi:ssRNA-specific RNase YbeY (16S rRNA maturation enzyme)